MLVTCCFFVIHCEIYKQFLSKNYLYTFFFSLYFMLKWLLRSASSSDSISFCQVLTLGSDQGLSSTAPHFHHLSDGTYLLFSLAATQAFLAARTLSSEEKKKKKTLCVHYQSLRRQSVLRQWKHALRNLPFWPEVPISCQFITENGRLSFSLPTELS